MYFDGKPGRPPADAPIEDRIFWSLWQAYAHIPDPGEAGRIHALIKEFPALKNELSALRFYRNNYVFQLIRYVRYFVKYVIFDHIGDKFHKTQR